MKFKYPIGYSRTLKRKIEILRIGRYAPFQSSQRLLVSIHLLPLAHQFQEYLIPCFFCALAM